jgi:transmembrane sensor
MDYRNFTTEDYVANDFFQNWVMYPDSDNNKFWLKFLEDNPDKRAEIDQAAWLISNTDFTEKWSEQERTDIWTNIQHGLIRPQNGSFILRLRRIAWLAAASIICILAALVIWTTGFQMKEIATSFGEMKKITLPDGSVVTLNANSRVKYRSDFLSRAKREMWIEGEGFFEITKRVVSGKKMPFTVHANNLSIQVLGTAFNVANRRGNVNVALEHGAVKVVDQNNQKNTVTLRPGEGVAQAGNEPRLIKQVVEVGNSSSWKNRVIIFKKKSLKEIAEMMKDLYDMEVVIDNPALLSETFTGSFPSDSSEVLFQKLDKMYPMEITRKGNAYHLR